MQGRTQRPKYQKLKWERQNCTQIDGMPWNLRDFSFKVRFLKNVFNLVLTDCSDKMKEIYFGEHPDLNSKA